MSINRYSLALFLVTLLVARWSIAQPTPSKPSTLQSEIARMMDILGWPRMVGTTLQRGDLQRVAVSKLAVKSTEAVECVNTRYTQQLVLDEIAKGYERVYTDPAIVAEISRFYGQPAGQRILNKVAARAPAVGASAAYEESKSSHWDMLTPEEKRAFGEFGTSPAGQAYIQGRPTQQKVHGEVLLALASRIASECSR